MKKNLSKFFVVLMFFSSCNESVKTNEELFNEFVLEMRDAIERGNQSKIENRHYYSSFSPKEEEKLDKMFQSLGEKQISSGKLVKNSTDHSFKKLRKNITSDFLFKEFVIKKKPKTLTSSESIILVMIYSYQNEEWGVEFEGIQSKNNKLFFSGQLKIKEI